MQYTGVPRSEQPLARLAPTFPRRHAEACAIPARESAGRCEAKQRRNVSQRTAAILEVTREQIVAERVDHFTEAAALGSQVTRDRSSINAEVLCDDVNPAVTAQQQDDQLPDTVTEPRTWSEVALQMRSGIARHHRIGSRVG